MIFCGLLFDHEQKMRPYVADAIGTAVPVLTLLLHEALKSETNTAKRAALQEKIEELDTTSPFMYFLKGLCVLFGEDFYIKEADVSL